MPKSRVVQVMEAFKADLLNRESAQVVAMVQRWRQVEVRLEAQIAALSEEVARTTTSGVTMSVSQIVRLERYQSLLAQTREQIRGYEGYAAQTITQKQLEWGRLGMDQAARAIQESYWDAGLNVSFNRLPSDAVERMVGLAGDGSPLFDVLQKRALYPDAVQGLTDALVQGVARGWNPRKTASRMADGLAGGLDKALTIARTEQLRVFRNASQSQYRASGVVTSYRRLSAHDGRVCAGCLAEDGQECELDLDFEAHPNCRCTTIPVCEGVEPPEWTAGGDWFGEQDEETQRNILGPGRYELWQKGQVSDFRRFATHTQNDIWGGAVVPTPVSELLGAITEVIEEAPEIVFPEFPQAFVDLMSQRGIEMANTAEMAKAREYISALPKEVLSIWGEQQPKAILGYYEGFLAEAQGSWMRISRNLENNPEAYKHEFIHVTLKSSSNATSALKRYMPSTLFQHATDYAEQYLRLEEDLTISLEFFSPDTDVWAKGLIQGDFSEDGDPLTLAEAYLKIGEVRKALKGIGLWR